MGKVRKGLTARQKKAIELLSDLKDEAETARELNVSAATIGKWFNEPEFTQALNESINGAIALSDSIMRLNAPEASKSICQLSKNAASESVRLQASKEVVAYAKAAEEQKSGGDGQIIKLIEGLAEGQAQDEQK